MSQAPARRGPYAKTSERRARIAEAALAVVLEKGHRGLTTAAVAERAGLSERTMLYHFPTRDHLLVAALEHSDQMSGDALADRSDMKEEGLAAIPRLLVGKGTSTERIMRLYSAMSAEADNRKHPAHAYFLSHQETTLVVFAQLVRDEQHRGLAHPDLDPGAVARQLFAVWAGLQSLWLVSPSFDLTAELQDAFRRLTGRPAMETRQALSALVEQL